jgi:SNF2 family DNA or RNA helicase
MLTATPLAAFSQFELLKPGALGFETFEEFKNHFADYAQETRKDGRKYPRLVGYKNLDVLRKLMSPYTSVVLREDVKDMPALNRETVTIEATEEQLRIYRELHHSIMVEIGEEEVSIGELAQRIGKLQQVFSGFLIDEFKDVHIIEGENPRLEALVREFYLAPGKVIVWCQFQRDIDFVAKRLRLEGYKAVEYHGRISDREKAESLRAFMTRKDVKGLIGQAQAGGRGKDMSEASSIIWYSHTFSARIREQAMERASKIGGGNIRVLDFVAPGPDRYMLSVTDGRVRMADSLTGSGMKALLGGLAL